MTKILPFTSGGWLLFTSSIYAIVGLFNVFAYKFTEIEYIQPVWLLITALPLFIKMHWLVSVDTVWEQMKYD